MRNYGFGALFTIPSGSYPTPKRFAVLKDVSFEMGGDIDALRGEKMFSIAAAKKNGKASGKIGVAQLDPEIIPYVIPGAASATGTVKIISEESGTVPAPSGPYTVTVAQSATWSVDLGVLDVAAGTYMARGSSATGTGVYSCAAGVYTFHSSDASKAVKISYAYTAVTGHTYTVTNSVMTTSTAVSMYLFAPNFRIYLPAVHIPKLGYSIGSEKWTEYQLEYEAVANASDIIAYKYFDE